MNEAGVRIIIAERNPRVRDFLSREFARKRFIVEGASSGDALFAMLNSGAQTHIVVLDVNAAENSGRDLLQRIVANYPTIPVILHTYLEDISDDPTFPHVAAMVEKKGNPEDLTKVVMSVLERLYPELMEAAGLEDHHV